MANNSNNDDFPTIRLDEEDRRDYQKKRQPSTSTTATATSTASPVTPKASTNTSGNGIWIILVALIAIAACGGCYYLYTLLEQQKSLAAEADKRIVQLENKLSATGEEIGESTVALQVKVTELSNKTNELWEQMDKLWASAWRRNQKEIADLGDRVSSVQNTLQTNINNVSSNVKAQNGEIGSVKNQLASLSDEILALNVQLEQVISDSQGDVQAVRNIADKLTVLEQRNASLSGRITGLESEIREIATKLVSSAGSSASKSPGGTPATTSPTTLPQT